MFWATISFLPLSSVALIAYLRLEGIAGSADQVHSRVMYAIILIGFSAALGGAWLTWIIARTMVDPLRRLELAMEGVRGGDLDARVTVGSTDEIGAVETGFNEMTQRIARSYEALQTKNRELAEALDKLAYLEAVKRGLDRFVPDTVRRLIEENPQSPALQKSAKDVTILFLDIQGYMVLSEQLPPALLNEIVENYFSMYLADIRAAGGDINETAGDGLMIIFQASSPLEHAASAVSVALGHPEKNRGEKSRRKGQTSCSGGQHGSGVRRKRRWFDQVSRHGGRALDLHRFRAQHESSGAPRRLRPRRPDSSEYGNGRAGPG